MVDRMLKSNYYYYSQGAILSDRLILAVTSVTKCKTMAIRIDKSTNTQVNNSITLVIQLV